MTVNDTEEAVLPVAVPSAHSLGFARVLSDVTSALGRGVCVSLHSVSPFFQRFDELYRLAFPLVCCSARRVFLHHCVVGGMSENRSHIFRI